MHIAEGIITGSKVVMYSGAGVALVGAGVWRMKKFVSDFPDKRALLGMGGALIFFISLIHCPLSREPVPTRAGLRWSAFCSAP